MWNSDKEGYHIEKKKQHFSCTEDFFLFFIILLRYIEKLYYIIYLYNIFFSRLYDKILSNN